MSLDLGYQVKAGFHITARKPPTPLHLTRLSNW